MTRLPWVMFITVTTPFSLNLAKTWYNQGVPDCLQREEIVVLPLGYKGTPLQVNPLTRTIGRRPKPSSPPAGRQSTNGFRSLLRK